MYKQYIIIGIFVPWFFFGVGGLMFLNFLSPVFVFLRRHWYRSFYNHFMYLFPSSGRDRMEQRLTPFIALLSLSFSLYLFYSVSLLTSRKHLPHNGDILIFAVMAHHLLISLHYCLIVKFNSIVTLHLTIIETLIFLNKDYYWRWRGDTWALVGKSNV